MDDITSAIRSMILDKLDIKIDTQTFVDPDTFQPAVSAIFTIKHPESSEIITGALRLPISRAEGVNNAG